MSDGKIIIPSTYYYKGVSCCNIILEKDNLGGIVIKNDYYEVMARCICGSEIAQFILDLQNCKYA